MSLSLHSIKPAKGSVKKAFVVGRGHGSGIGKTAGRGTKGQGSRTGASNLQYLGFRRLMMSIKKNRGFTSMYAKVTTVTLSDLSKHFEKNAHVNANMLVKKGLLASAGMGAKIVATGSLKHAVVIDGLQVSEGAKKKIVEAGGTVNA